MRQPPGFTAEAGLCLGGRNYEKQLVSIGETGNRVTPAIPWGRIPPSKYLFVWCPPPYCYLDASGHCHCLRRS
jgi:hypothetical protein